MKEQKFLLSSLILLTLIGGPAVYSVVNEPVVRGRLAADLNARKPASAAKNEKQDIVAEESTHRNAIKAKSVTIDLACDSLDQTQETDGTLLRLKSDCWKAEGKGLAITNKTNGFTASIIETKTQGFTTDFIDLQEGDNRLEIIGTNLKGEAVHKVMTVRRRLPASEASTQD